MYSKVWFSSKYYGRTAALVLHRAQQETLTISEISRMFPYSESMKMERLNRGDYFDTWEQAFNDDIDNYSN